MRRKCKRSRLRLIFKLKPLWLTEFTWLLSNVILLVGFSSQSEGQWNSFISRQLTSKQEPGLYAEDNTYFGNKAFERAYQEALSASGAASGYGNAVRQINGFNIVDLNQINNNNNLNGNFQPSRLIPKEYGTSSFASSVYSNGMNFENGNLKTIGYGSSMGGGYNGDAGYVEYAGNSGYDNANSVYGENNGNDIGEMNGNACGNGLECFGNYGYGSTTNEFANNINSVGGNYGIQPNIDKKQQIMMGNDNYNDATRYGTTGQACNGNNADYGSQIRNIPTRNNNMNNMALSNYGIGNGMENNAYGMMPFTNGDYNNRGYGSGYGSGYAFNGENNNFVLNNGNNDYYDTPMDFGNGNGNGVGYDNNRNGGFSSQNMKKYAEYLELINKKYGIRMPGRNVGNENPQINTVIAKNANENTVNINSPGGEKPIVGNTMGTVTSFETISGDSNSQNSNIEEVYGNFEKTTVSPVTMENDCAKRSLNAIENDAKGGYGSLSSYNGASNNNGGYYSTNKNSGYQNGAPGNEENLWQNSACSNQYISVENNTLWNNGNEKSFGSFMNEPTQRSASSIQALTQQIRRLPSVLYLNSEDVEAVEAEQLLRKTYGLPLVAFYVDKMDSPQNVAKNLEQLTAFNKMPYLFICGTFIGSQEHIDKYYKNKQFPQLVEYVCGEQKRVNTSAEKKTDEKTAKKIRRKKKKAEKIVAKL